MITENKHRIELPPKEIRFMNETDELFHQIGAQNLNVLKSHGFKNGKSILDIGSGYGRLAYAILEAFPDFNGTYVGLDILEKHVNWCIKAFNSEQPFRFHRIDLINGRYNSSGSSDASTYEFEFPDCTFDSISLFSVFTHMYENEILNYLSEIRRLLSNEGKCVATFFTFDDELLRRIEEREKGIKLPHSLNEHCRYLNPDDPLQAIAFQRDYLVELIKSKGLEINRIEFGHWSGIRTEHYQDIFVLSRSRKD